MYNSQVGQDRWVHSILGDKRDGFFIELGACDGVHLSNTLFFERNLDWKGICIEPNDNFLPNLVRNRKSFISNDLIYSHEGEVLNFSQCNDVSGVTDNNIGPFTSRSPQCIVKKTTTTLAKVLERFNAPKIIDYLSLDVEGQEYNILKTFPFDTYSFRCMTIEHNEPHIGSEMQMNIRKLLESHGYRFVKGNDDVQNWRHGPIDDFYIHPEFI